MIIGSNNSLTYLEPCSRLSKIFKHWGKCQNRDYEIQYSIFGARFFDLKLFVNERNHIIVKNGTYKYPLFSFYEILDFFNKKGDVMVLITLEKGDSESQERMETIERRFTESCRAIETIYEHIKFCGGYRQEDKKRLYSFAWEEENEIPTIINPFEDSKFYRFVSRWCFWLIGKLNKRYIKEYDKSNVVLMLNYVDRNS